MRGKTLRFALAIFLTLLTPLFSKTHLVNYDVFFSVLGQVAAVKSHYKSSKNRYELVSKVVAVGVLAKLATGNLKETHTSKGYIKGGKHFTTHYTMNKRYRDVRSTTLYTLNHKTKQIVKSYKSWRVSNTKEKLTTSYQRKLGYYAMDDLIIFFLNLNKHIKHKTNPKTHTFKVAGADKQNGRVDVRIPKNTTLHKELLGKLNKDEWYSTVVMHRQIYNSKQGELLVRMGKESLIEKAVLKDIILYGDVRIVRQ